MPPSDRPTHSERVVFPSRPEELEQVHAALDRFLAAAGDAPGIGREWGDALRTALGEIAANVVTHAYPDGIGEIELTLEFYPDRVETFLRDSGQVVQLPEHDTLPDDLDQSGRGLFIAELLVDTLDYHRADGTNTWRLVKYHQPGQ